MFHLDILDYVLSARDTMCDPKFDVFKNSTTTAVLGDDALIDDASGHGGVIVEVVRRQTRQTQGYKRRRDGSRNGFNCLPFIVDSNPSRANI